VKSHAPWQLDVVGTLNGVFLGENLLPWLVLALGAAMAVGSALALVRPPTAPRAENDLPTAPLARSVVMIVVGAVAAVWALASLVNG
jgi:xanthosine utilization system XapX-like protein